MQQTTKDTKILKIAAFVSLAFGAILTLTGSDDLAEFYTFSIPWITANQVALAAFGSF